MPRIAGIDIPENKRIEFSLTYIFGIGRTLALQIISHTNIDLGKKASELTSQEVNMLKDFI